MKKGRILTVLILGLIICTGQAAFAGSIIGWGNNYNGQIDCPEGNDYFAIAAGNGHSLALKTDGSIEGWGRDDYGQATPPAGNDFVAIAGGGRHSLALKQDGSIVGWGRNNDGQTTPPAGHDFVAVAAGAFHSLALKQDGSIIGWGNNDEGQATPPAGNDFVAIAAGAFHNLALKQDGSIVGWGNDDEGQATPPAGNDYTVIATGDIHSLALKADGSIVGWGRDNYGQATPPAGNDFVAISGGAFHSLALKQDGSIVGWGFNGDGQATPPAGSDFVAVAGGESHSLALKKSPIGTGFTYQGRLIDNNDVADGSYDFQFKLFDAVSAGNQLSNDVNKPEVDVIDGYFTVELDFGSVFDDYACWLEISVRPGEENDPCEYTKLEPRQPVTPTPYAMYAKTAGSGGGADSGWTISGNDMYSNVSGNVGIRTTNPIYILDANGHINSSESYKLDGQTILSNSGTGNIFVGQYAGISNTTGYYNSAVGYGALNLNTTGFYNSAMGVGALNLNTGGYENSAMGHQALYANITGSSNSAGGAGVLYSNTTGCENSAMGHQALYTNTTGHRNSAIGAGSLYSNTTGNNNTAIGVAAGRNSTGSGNVFLGYQAGYNETGSNKLYIANNAADANVLIYGDFAGGNVGIGTTNPGAELDVDGDLKVTGAYKGNISSTSGSDGAPFPRPAYDSGWTAISAGYLVTLDHNIGGNVDNYVVDMQFKSASSGIHNMGIGRYHVSSIGNRGAFCQNLTTSTIAVYRMHEDTDVEYVRIRIWVYN